MRYLITILFALAGCGAIHAQTPAKSLLWEISGKNLARPSYVFGTIHMLCPDDVIWTPAMENSLKAASLVCMELDLDDPATLQAMMAGMQGKEGKTLRELLDTAALARLKTFAKDSAGIDPATIEATDPANLPMLFMTKLLPCGTPASYEARIAMEAAGSRKPVEGLETVAEQLALLDLLNDDTTSEAVMQLVDSFSAMRAQFARMVSTYRNQELDSLAVMIESTPILGAQSDALLHDRNHRWIPRLEKYMRRGSAFIAVGAGHLPGKDGVLQLLRNAGYTVRPLK